MLKIAEGIDLKALERCGFKPKFDEDTGNIKRYILEGEAKTYFDGERKIWFLIVEKYKDEWILKVSSAYEIALDFLYDLIQAGIVVKE